MALRIGIIGCGRVARHHAIAFAAAGASVVAGSTRRPDSPNWRAFLQVAPQARYVPDGAAMLSDDGVDAVVACLPWHEMPRWTARLLAAPKPVLLEKPIALSVMELELALPAASNGATKLVGFNRRFYDTVARLRDRLDQGGLKAVHADISEDIARHLQGHGPDILEHVFAFASSHSLDLLLHLVGPLRPVRIHRHLEPRYGGRFASVNGLLETASGVPVFLGLNADDPVSAGLRFLFDDGTRWSLAPLETLTIYRGYDIAQEAEGSAIRRYRPKVEAQYEEPAGTKPGFVAQARAFLADRVGPGATPLDSLPLLRLIGTLQSADLSAPTRPC